MSSVRKITSEVVQIDTTNFNNPLSILDSNSIDVQKAFQDINDNLVLASATNPGLISSSELTKLESIAKGLHKGDILVSDGNGDFQLLPIGNNKEILEVDNTTALGIKWIKKTIGTI